MSKITSGVNPGAFVLACAMLAPIFGASAQTAGSGEPAQPFAGVTAFGKTLQQNGIYLTASYAEDFSALVSGGKQTGIMPIGHAAVGAVFDLQTIAGITGASFHVIFDERNGETINGIAGNPSQLLQSDGGPFKTRLGQFYWEQGFDNDRLDITVGRTNPTFDFSFSNISCSFVGVICAQPTTWYFNNANTAYPSAQWGGRANFAVTPEVYVRAGVYQHDPRAGLYDNAGFEWDAKGSVGVFVPVEIGYVTSFKTAAYPVKYNVGFYEDTASYTTSSGTLGSRHAEWAEFQQAVWRPDRNTNQSISLFGGALIYGGNSPNWGQYYLGLTSTGLMPSRPADVGNFIASLVTNNSAIKPSHSKETLFELNYGIHAYSGITVKPYAQYLVNPTDAGLPAGSATAKNAWIVGVQVVLNLAELFEFPQFIPH